MSDAMRKNWKKLQRNPFFKAGLPLLLFMSFSFYALQKFIEGKKQLEDLSRGKKTMTTREYDLEEDWKKTMKKLNPEYEIKKIPRPD